MVTFLNYYRSVFSVPVHCFRWSNGDGDVGGEGEWGGRGRRMSFPCYTVQLYIYFLPSIIIEENNS